MNRPISILLAALIALSGCDMPFAPAGPGFCTTEDVPGIVVQVIDAETGAPAAEGVDGWVFDVDYSDSLQPRNSTDGQLVSLSGAGERPGDYLVRLRKPGYQEWVVSHVRVGRDECHVVTQFLVARLQRAP